MENIKEKLEAFAAECRKGNTQEWEGGSLECADLSGADLSDVYLTYADLEGANLEGANLESAELRGADLYGAVLTDAKLWGADLRGATLEDSIGFRFEDAPDPQELRYKVANLIESSPELHDQNNWGEGDSNECNTPCCTAGWACRLGGGTRGYWTEDAATRLLHVDGKVMPSFKGGAEREDILAALRS